MSIILYTVLLLLCIGATSIVVRSNACASSGTQHSPSGFGQYAVIFSIPCMVLFGAGLLMTNSGISLEWVLGTLLAAFCAMAVGIWQIDVSGSYENRWGSLAYLSIPVWIIAGAITALVRIFF